MVKLVLNSEWSLIYLADSAVLCFLFVISVIICCCKGKKEKRIDDIPGFSHPSAHVRTNVDSNTPNAPPPEEIPPPPLEEQRPPQHVQKQPISQITPIETPKQPFSLPMQHPPPFQQPQNIPPGPSSPQQLPDQMTPCNILLPQMQKAPPSYLMQQNEAVPPSHNVAASSPPPSIPLTQQNATGPQMQQQLQNQIQPQMQHPMQQPTQQPMQHPTQTQHPMRPPMQQPTQLQVEQTTQPVVTQQNLARQTQPNQEEMSISEGPSLNLQRSRSERSQQPMPPTQPMPMQRRPLQQPMQQPIQQPLQSSSQQWSAESYGTPSFYTDQYSNQMQQQENFYPLQANNVPFPQYGTTSLRLQSWRSGQYPAASYQGMYNVRQSQYSTSQGYPYRQSQSRRYSRPRSGYPGAEYPRFR